MLWVQGKHIYLLKVWLNEISETVVKIDLDYVKDHVTVSCGDHFTDFKSLVYSTN